MKVPFARRKSDGTIVGVADVLRGKAADCTCLSCGRSVIARQGEKVIWHFAHEFSESSADLCRYSVFESVREAVLWLLPQLGQIRVPGVGNRRGTHVELANISMKPLVDGTPVDASATILGYELFFWVSYPGRHWLGDASAIADKAGFLCLEIDEFIRKRSGETLSVDRLKRWLEDDESGKHWFRHPLLRLSSSTNIEHGGSKSKMEHHCVMCEATWIGDPTVDSATCADCDSHLYVQSKPLN